VPRDGKKANQHKLVRIVRRQMRVLKRSRYPLRNSRFANHLYTDHQHVVLLALRQHFRKSYRDFCEILEVCDSLLEELGLRRVPHWTTLHKFSKRAETRRLERLLLAYLEEARVRVLYLAVELRRSFHRESTWSYPMLGGLTRSRTPKEYELRLPLASR